MLNTENNSTVTKFIFQLIGSYSANRGPKTLCWLHLWQFANKNSYRSRKYVNNLETFNSLNLPIRLLEIPKQTNLLCIFLCATICTQNADCNFKLPNGKVMVVQNLESYTLYLGVRGDRGLIWNENANE